MEKCIDGYIQKDRQIERWENGQMDTYRKIDRQKDGKMEKWIDGYIQKDRKIERWKCGQMDTQIYINERQIDRFPCTYMKFILTLPNTNFYFDA